MHNILWHCYTQVSKHELSQGKTFITNKFLLLCPNTLSHTKDNMSLVVSKKWSKCWAREWGLAFMTQSSLRTYRGPINTVTKIVSSTNRECSVLHVSCDAKLLRRASHLLTREWVARLIRLVHLMPNNWTHPLEYDLQWYCEVLFIYIVFIIVEYRCQSIMMRYVHA